VGDARGKFVVTMLLSNSLGPGGATLRCRDCPMWYGAEDDGWGPCSLKHQRGDVRYLTHGSHVCDENYRPPPLRIEGNAAELSGVRSTSSESSVGYTSTAKAGKGSRRANRRSRSGANSTRRRPASTR
jgi:hypothetical protein